MPSDERKTYTTTVSSRGLLDAAIENFRIAREYMDDASCGIEQKLISFHLAIALLAQPEPTSSNLAEAEHLLLEARDWNVDRVETDLAANRERLEGSGKSPQFALPAADEVKKAIYRIITEASYNLGVVYELQQDYVRASRAYGQSTAWAQKYPELAPVSILSRFGEISIAAADGEPVTESTRHKIALLRGAIAAWQEAGSISAPDDISTPRVEVGRNKWYQRLGAVLGFNSQNDHSAEPIAMSPSQVSQFTSTLDAIRERLTEIESQPLGAVLKTSGETLDAE